MRRWFPAEWAFSWHSSSPLLLCLCPRYLPPLRSNHQFLSSFKLDLNCFGQNLFCWKTTLVPGVPRPYSSHLLGSCPLPLHLRCNSCLRSAAHPDPVLEGGVQRARGGEGPREESSDYWQADASSLLLPLSPLQHIVLASLPLRTKVNIKRCIGEIVLLLHRRKSTPLQHIILARLPLWSKVMHWQNNTGCIWKEWHCVFYLLKYIFWRLFSISCGRSSLPWSCCQGLSWERIAFYSAPCSYD